MCRSNQTLLQYKFSILAIPFVLLLSFVLGACGTNIGAGNSPSTPSASCPNQTVVATPPPAANVVLNSSKNNSTVSVHKGDTIEVDLSSRQQWEESTATAVSQNLLTEQTPSGYVLASSHMCVWRFVATSTGTTQLTFVGRPICQQGQACPQYIMALSFTIEIK